MKQADEDPPLPAVVLIRVRADAPAEAAATATAKHSPAPGPRRMRRNQVPVSLNTGPHRDARSVTAAPSQQSCTCSKPATAHSRRPSGLYTVKRSQTAVPRIDSTPTTQQGPPRLGRPQSSLVSSSRGRTVKTPASSLTAAGPGPSPRSSRTVARSGTAYGRSGSGARSPPVRLPRSGRGTGRSP